MDGIGTPLLLLSHAGNCMLFFDNFLRRFSCFPTLPVQLSLQLPRQLSQLFELLLLLLQLLRSGQQRHLLLQLLDLNILPLDLILFLLELLLEDFHLRRDAIMYLLSLCSELIDVVVIPLQLFHLGRG